jgi:hypothetical protein
LADFSQPLADFGQVGSNLPLLARRRFRADGMLLAASATHRSRPETTLA